MSDKSDIVSKLKKRSKTVRDHIYELTWRLDDPVRCRLVILEQISRPRSRVQRAGRLHGDPGHALIELDDTGFFAKELDVQPADLRTG
jgi:hypothetical protein